MSNQQLEPVVHIGTLKDMGTIETKENELVGFSDIDARALWSYLRLEMGKKKADSEIKTFRLGHKGIDALKLAYFNLKDQLKQRELQFIMVGDEVKAVASLDHLLIPPQEVLDIAMNAMPSLQPHPVFPGRLSTELDDQLPGVNLYYSLDPGNILTRRAIRMGYSIHVLLCTNPLSYMGIGHLNRFKIGGFGGEVDKILRVKRKNELGNSIKTSIERSVENLGEFTEMVEQSKKVHVTETQAKILLTAFPTAYGAGKPVVKQIIERYSKEDKTLWGLAQATSYIARYGSFSQNAKSMYDKLATAGAAYVGIMDLPETTDLANKWLLEKKDIDIKEWL